MKSASKVFLSFLLFSLSPFNMVFAQQEFKLSGVLIENGSKIRIALAEITNKRNNYSVGSNDLGLFEIKAAVGDTLLITKRGFYDLQVVVINSQSLVLKLNKGIMLNEVLIKGKSKEQALTDIDNDFKDKGSFYAGKPPLALLSPFGGSPLTFFYELFGKTPRNARRFRKYHVTENQQTRVDQFFNRETIHKTTGLDGKELDNFMISYRPDYEQSKNWTTYDATKWINDSFKKYTSTLNNNKQQ